MNIPALLDELERLEKQATPGPILALDNFLEKEKFEGERGNTIAEFFSGNPMYGDNSNDTHFYAHARNSLSTLIQFCREAAQVTEFYAEAEYIPEGLNDKTDLGEKAREFRRKWGLE